MTLFKVYSALDRTKKLTLLSPDPEHYFVTQSGLLGEGLPSHKAMYAAESDAYSLAQGKNELSVSLKALDAGGAQVEKRFIFRRGTYEIAVAYSVKNAGDKPLSPFAYFQFLRDGNQPSQEAAQTSAIAGVATFTGPAVYTDEAKFVKVDFKDVDKGKQTHARKAKDGWIAIVQHYFVSAWLPKGPVERGLWRWIERATKLLDGNSRIADGLPKVDKRGS